MKNNHDIVEKIKVLLAEQLDRLVTSFEDEESFADNGCDEFDLIELTMSLEDAFGIALDDELSASMSLVDCADVIAHRKNKKK